MRGSPRFRYTQDRNRFFIFEMSIDWDDLKLFLDVARMGGLSAASRTNGVSAPTLGRRITALENEIGEPLFIRAQTGYRLTSSGEALLERAQDVEAAMTGLLTWQQGHTGERVVRISAGSWTSSFLARSITRIWQPEDHFRIELVTANERVDIGHRHADLGIRNARPTEQWLAGRQIGHVAFALYSGRTLKSGVAAGMFVGLSGAAVTPSARWLTARHGDRIGVRGNDAQSIRELVAAGAGITVLPCFVGDSDPRLVRIAGIVPELTTEQWLVSHHDERHNPVVRQVSRRIARLMRENKELFAGERPFVPGTE